ncbi:MAG: triple tyrosine motif-containing protein [Bacteroidales bacterium]
MKNHLKHWTVICLAVFLFSSFSAFSQVEITGIPFIINYSKNIYSGGTQNWTIDQSPEGILYFANNEGLLEFDGVFWKSYKISNNSVIRSLKISDKGTIFIGAYNEFGYFEPNKTGVLTYHSLIDKLPAGIKDFDEIWKIHIVNNDIYFQSFKYIFKYSNNSIEVFEPESRMHFSYVVNSRLFVWIEKKGLAELVNNKFQELGGNNLLKGQKVWSMLPYKGNKIIVSTATGGFFILENNQIEKWKTPIDDFLSKNQIFCGSKLSNNQFAFGTVQNGVIIIDENGVMLNHINKSRGLQNNTVLSILNDNNGNIWLGLDNGIDFIELNSPFTYFNDKSGIEGTGYAAAQTDRFLYLGTNQGLYCLEVNGKNQTITNFELIENTRGQVWNLTKIDNTLFCGHDNGIYIIKGKSAIKISDIDGAWAFLQSKQDKYFIIVGTYNGLVLLRKSNKNDEWIFFKKIEGFEESSRFIESDNNGSIWISHGYKGLFKLNLSPALDSVTNLQYYNSRNGLPSDQNNIIAKINNEIVVATINGIYKYNSLYNTFEPDNILNRIYSEKGKIEMIDQDKDLNIYFIREHKIGIAWYQKDGSYKYDETSMSKLKSSLVGGFENLSFLKSDQIIINTEEGFSVYNKNNKPNELNQPFVLLKEIYMSKDKDSLIYGGSILNNEITTSTIPVRYKITIPYKYNSLKFVYSALNIEQNQNIEYSYKLENFSENWSEWNNSNQKEYTSLHEGVYIFKIKAKIGSITNHQPTEIHIEVLAPWYRTVIAYILYILFILSAIIFMLYAIIKRIEKSRRRLVLKKEKEINDQKRLYEEKSAEKEKEIIRLRNEQLEKDLIHKSKELANSTMHLIRKNEILTDIKLKLIDLKTKIKNPVAIDEIGQMINVLDKNILHKKDWAVFETNFEKVHENFWKRLDEKFPNLNYKEKKLCAYLRMNLLSKEIAPLLNISVRGAEISRYRLRKKLNVPHDSNLIEFIQKI